MIVLNLSIYVVFCEKYEVMKAHKCMPIIIQNWINFFPRAGGARLSLNELTKSLLKYTVAPHPHGAMCVADVAIANIVHLEHDNDTSYEIFIYSQQNVA